MPNIRLTLEYDGAAYHGWQRQPSVPTIQGTIEAAVRAVSREKVNVTGAGRTDAGVHALGQVANFKTRSRLAADVWVRALNRYLPDDIAILRAERVPAGFHSRYDALEKTYEYHILNRRVRTAMGRQYLEIVHPPLDLARMRRGARPLIGRHDFTAYRAGGLQPEEKSSICTLREIRIVKRGDEVRILLRADRFLYQMVRTIVGTLVEVGLERRPAADMQRILASKNRGLAGQTAPANGLFLVKVVYRKTDRA